jgi:hypothetical protein
MAKKNAQVDRAQAKAAKQKKVAIALSGVLVLVLVFEVPKTLKMMNAKAKAPVVSASASTPPAATPTATPASLPATPASEPTPTAAPSLVSSVQVLPDPGQLTQFSEFASKDPFGETVQKTAGPGTTGSTPSSVPTTPSKPKTPPAPPPNAAVLSVNGELMSVAVGAQFPTAGTVFDEIGSPLFQLDALTGKTAKVSIAGGSYASGAPSLTLTVGKPVTLQNTADGTRYTLLLEPPGTPVPATTPGSTGTTSTTPTTTTPDAGTVVPSGGG